MQLDRGYLSPYFVTNSERMEAQINDPYILITDKKISSAQDIVPVLEKMVQIGKRDMVIIAEDVDGEALATLVLNKLRGMVNALAIKAPGFGDRRKAMLRDIATLTGGQVITEELGRTLDSVQLDDLGRAARLISTKDTTTIVDGAGESSDIQGRVEQISRRDRSQHERLRPREAAGALGQAGRWRRYPARGRGDGDRAQVPQDARRGCAERNPRGGRRGRGARRWRGADQLDSRAGQAEP